MGAARRIFKLCGGERDDRGSSLPNKNSEGANKNDNFGKARFKNREKGTMGNGLFYAPKKSASDPRFIQDLAYGGLDVNFETIWGKLGT